MVLVGMMVEKVAVWTGADGDESVQTGVIVWISCWGTSGLLHPAASMQITTKTTIAAFGMSSLTLLLEEHVPFQDNYHLIPRCAKENPECL